jgi:RNA recognition motif-containing protein
VRKYFGKFGDVCEVKILQNSSGDLVGRGIVQFTKEKSATKAIKLCNGKDFMGKKWNNILFTYLILNHQTESKQVKSMYKGQSKSSRNSLFLTVWCTMPGQSVTGHFCMQVLQR